MAAVLALGHQLAIERQQNQAEIERRQHESDSTDFIRARSAVQRLITANPDHEDLQVIGDLIVISSRADYRFYLDLAQLLARWPSDWVYHAYPAAKLLRELQTIATSPSSHKEALVDPPDRYLALRQALLLSHRRNYWIWCTRGAPAKRDDPDFIDEGRKLGVPDFCLMELAEDASKWARVSYLLRLPPEFHAEHWDEIRQMEVGNPLEQQRPLSDFFTFPEKPPAYTIRPRDELMTYPPAVG